MPNTLELAIEGIRSIWKSGTDGQDVIAGCRRHLENLARADMAEEWLASLHREGVASRELYRDPMDGFVLLAHVERPGQYRSPHDHGRGWVIYAVQRGEMEMGRYVRTEGAGGRVRLVKVGLTRVRPGEAQVYLPGDIHDTRCLKGPALQIRFTERDLKQEDQQGHRVRRYVERDGFWTA